MENEEIKNYLDSDGLLYYDTKQKERLNEKVDKELKTGSTTDYKVLSDNNLTDELKQKIENAGDSSFTGNYDDLTNKPTKLSDFENDEGFQTASEVQSSINNALADITGVDYEVVDSLPETGEKGIIYLVPNGGSNPNIYDEYIYANDVFEKIGTTEVDLSNYWNRNNLRPMTNAEIEAIISEE